MFVVGVDIRPGRYVLQTGDGGWVRYRNDGPVTGSSEELELTRDDVAVEFNGTWQLAELTAASYPPHAMPLCSPETPADVAATIRTHGRLLHGTLGYRERMVVLVAPAFLLPAMLAYLLNTATQAAGQSPSLLAFVAAVAVGFAGGAATPFLPKGKRQWARIRALRFLHTRPADVILPERLPPDRRALIARAQEAIGRITASTALDQTENAPTLRREEWEIASALARLPLRELDADRGTLAELDELLAEEDRTERAVWDSVTSRVEALEEYAAHAVEADRLHRAYEQVERLSQRAGVYQDLLAETARDELGVAEVHRLDTHAQAIKEALTERLAQAAQAANRLIG